MKMTKTLSLPTLLTALLWLTACSQRYDILKSKADPADNGAPRDPAGNPDPNPPGTTPPGTTPPTTHPPGTTPPTTQPPTTNPPGTNPPPTNPPVTHPPGTNPPGGNPPGGNPPGTNPPTNPPGTNPPSTNPPGGNPPGTNPPGTNPPGGNPPPGTNPPGGNPPPTTPPPGGNPPGGNPPPLGDPPPTPVVLKKFKPVLAVRGLQCVMCHANVNSNIVTDFGLGTANFFKEAYGNVDISWRLGWQHMPGQVTGKVIIPGRALTSSERARIDKYTSKHAGLDLDDNEAVPNTLKQILDTPYRSHAEHWNDKSAVKQFPPMVDIVKLQSGARDPSPVVTRSQIIIRAPSESEITNLLPSNLRQSYPVVKKISDANKPLLSGLAIVNADSNWVGSGVKYVRNNDKLRCYGDVVIRGTLYLKDLNLETDAEGCRLYVTETVFIEGPVKSNRPNGQHNLQITSARAIMIGLGLDRLGVSRASYNDIKSGKTEVRIEDFNRNLKWNPYPHISRAYDYSAMPGYPSTRKAVFDKIAWDARKVGPQLKDSTDLNRYGSGLPSGYSYVTNSKGDKRISISYTGMLLNAPFVHNGYMGRFTGVIVADMINFVISHFDFRFDPMFGELEKVLPALKNPVLSISDN